MKATRLDAAFTKSIPAVPEAETLYISMEYQTAVHLCACGCGIKVVTPLGPNDWILTYDGTVTLSPSVGNGQQPCRSHYFIRGDEIVWLTRISKGATDVALERDRAAHAPAPASAGVRKPWWRRLLGWLRRIT